MKNMPASCAAARAAAALLLAAASLGAGEAAGPLEKYLYEDDGAFAVETRKSFEANGVRMKLLLLTSQKWRGDLWRHALLVASPSKPRVRDSAILVISGGSNRPGFEDKVPGEAAIAAQIAESTGSPVAVLGQVPNQPLFGGKHEDEIIALTFQKFFETGDSTWPLLLPMTKAAVKAMDAVAEALREGDGPLIRKFFVTGASKRGWTSWLTAASDSRVSAVAPMVIDMLNLQKHLPHQIETWGSYSESIGDYTSLGLPGMLEGGRGLELLKIIDPYFRRGSLAMPKFIILGTNDPYWPLDSAGLYFFDLEGPRFLHYVPNAGHGLNLTVVKTVSAFHDAAMSGDGLPTLDWAWSSGGGTISLGMKANPAPVRAALWRAVSKTRDFRAAKWSVDLTFEGGSREYEFAVRPCPDGGWVGAYASLTFSGPNGAAFALCSDARVFGPAGGGAGK